MWRGGGGAYGNAAITGGNVSYVLSKSGTAVSAGSDITEDTLATITVPANAIGINGELVVTAYFSYTNSANSKVLRVRYSGAAGTQYFAATRTTETNLIVYARIFNTGVANAQIGNSWGLSSGGAITIGGSGVTSAVDTTASSSIVITGQKALNTETLTLTYYEVLAAQ